MKRSSSLESLSVGVERTLPGADDHHLAVQLLRHGFRHLSDQRRTVVRVADVLLDLVENE